MSVNRSCIEQMQAFVDANRADASWSNIIVARAVSVIMKAHLQRSEYTALQTMEDPNLEDIQKNARKRYQRSISFDVRKELPRLFQFSWDGSEIVLAELAYVNSAERFLFTCGVGGRQAFMRKLMLQILQTISLASGPIAMFNTGAYRIAWALLGEQDFTVRIALLDHCWANRANCIRCS